MTIFLLILCISLRVSVYATSECSEDLPSYNETTFTGDALTGSHGGVQLLIPLWNFSCDGAITQWMAHVTGDSSVANSIEFQIFQPDPVKENVYNLIYGNMYNGAGAVGNNMITVIASGLNLRIPIRVGYIVGLHITSDALNMLYESTGDVDIYYWENVTERRCSLSLCDAKVIRGLNPLIGWIFKDFRDDSLMNLENAIEIAKEGNVYQCSESNVSSCNLTVDTSSIGPLPSSSSLALYISSMSLSTSTPPDMSSSISPPSSTITDISSTTTITTIPMTPPVVPSSTVTPTQPTDNPLPTEVIAVFGVAIILFIIVLILMLLMGICCLCKRKPSSSTLRVQSIENPDYTGAISTSGSVKKSEDFSMSLRNGGTPQSVPAVQPVPPPLHDMDDYDEPEVSDGVSTNRYSQLANVGSHTQSKLDTQRGTSSWVDTRQLASEVSPSLAQTEATYTNGKHGYSVPRPAGGSLHGKPRTLSESSYNKHHYSSPPPETAPPPPPPTLDPYYSVLEEGSDQHFISTINDIYDDPDDMNVPSTRDPEIVDNYDVVILDMHKKAIDKDNPQIYSYVPTQEQRVLTWRYEVPFDQQYNKLNFFTDNKTFWTPADTTSDLYQQLASNKYREIPRKDIVILKTLGAGQFGFVSKGLWTPPDGRHEVAIKILKPEASENDRLKLLQEAAIMGQFTNDYVVKLHGVVTIGDPVMMVLELMPRGDLRSYLRSIQQKINKMPSLAGLPKLLLKFCKDIASGMKYLSSKSFVHRDLAARNILLSSDLTCKIGDFGMTRDLMQDENDYYKSSGGIIPLKWTAPEALNFKKYTSSSDVWSYGMVLFEIWSLGHKPFNDLSNPIVIALVNSKHCQPPPPGCSRAIYQLMIECWNPEYTLRPSFERIIDYLSQSHEVLFNWNRGDFLHGKKAHLLGAPLDEAGDLYVELQRTYQQSMLDEFQKR